jgi:hypothetical protein
MIERPLETGLRLAAAILVLAAIAWRFGDVLTSQMLPLFAREIETVVPQFRILAIGMGSGGSDTVLGVEAGPAPVVMIAGKLLPLAPQSRFQATTLAGHVLQPVVLLLAILMAWPQSQRWRYAMRLAIGLPLLLLLPMLDVPLVLAAELEATLIELGRPGAFSALDAWKDFLEGGGRLAVPIVAAGACVALANTGIRAGTGAGA